jgi:hypothetical protein
VEVDMTTYKEGASPASRSTDSGSKDKPDLEAHNPMNDVATGVREVAGTVRDVATEVATQLPSVAATTRDVMEQAAQTMETSTSETLMAGTTLSLGLALGLLIGGANRILVALALLPAAAMGATLLDRQARTGSGMGAATER